MLCRPRGLVSILPVHYNPEKNWTSSSLETRRFRWASGVILASHDTPAGIGLVVQHDLIRIWARKHRRETPQKRHGCDTGGRYCSRGQGSAFLAPQPLNRHVPGSGEAHYPSPLCLFKQSCIDMVSMIHHRFFFFSFFSFGKLSIAPRIGAGI